MNAAAQYIITLDVGGSSVKSAVVGAGDLSVHGFRADALDSYGSAASIVDTLITVIDGHLLVVEAASVIGIAVGFPGPFDYERGISLMKGDLGNAAGASHTGGRAKFESIYGLNVREALRDRMGVPKLPIVFRNDAEAAIMGEAKYGAGRPFRRVIGVTLGTGLGSAFIVAGQLVTDGPSVPPHGWLYCAPFNAVQADEVFSTRGIMRRLRAAGVVVGDVKMASEAARAGNQHACTAFTDFGRDLGEFLGPYADAFHAQAILVMGGIANAFDLFQPALQKGLAVPAITGALGPHAALLGAADLMLQC